MLWYYHYGSFVYVCLMIGTVSQVSSVAHGHQVYQSKRVEYFVTSDTGVILDICTLTLH